MKLRRILSLAFAICIAFTMAINHMSVYADTEAETSDDRPFNMSIIGVESTICSIGFYHPASVSGLELSEISDVTIYINGNPNNVEATNIGKLGYSVADGGSHTIAFDPAFTKSQGEYSVSLKYNGTLLNSTHTLVIMSDGLSAYKETPVDETPITTAPPVTAPTPPITTLPAAVPTPPITTPPVTAPVSPVLPTVPAQPTMPAQSSMTVMPTPSKVFINGMETSFEAYHIDGSNYFKLRDIAFALNGTNKQFNLGYDNATAAITLLPGQPYIPAGGEMMAGDGQAKPATLTASKIYLNGGELSLTVYNIAGSNFFKLVDLMGVLNVGVTYNQTTGSISVDTNANFMGVVTVQ